MRDLKKVVWVALTGASLVAAACNDEKKPPLTPDGPEMTAPVGGGDGGVDTPTATPPLK